MNGRHTAGARRSGGGGGGAAAAASGRTLRMPQAPASLLVQLPPDELRRYMHDPSALAHLQSQQSSTSYHQQRIQPTDIDLLAASIQERRAREARTFAWQQRLIGGEAATHAVEREVLKRALTQLSLPAWLQVLQERHLAHRCAYPTCPKRPKKLHLSQRTNAAALPLDAPRYRISLRRRAIERDERDDAGGQNSFCGNACWRRGEWVSRWVLNGGEPTRQVQRDVSDEAFGSAIRDSAAGLGVEVDQGGRWERMMNEEHWTEIELLEELEERGEVDRLSDDEESIIPHSSSKPTSPRLEQLDDDGKDDSDERDVLHGQASQVARERAKQRANHKGTAESFLNMLDSLVIQERSHVGPSTDRPTTSDVHITLPNDKDDIVGELSSFSRDGNANMASLVKSSTRQFAGDAAVDSQGDVSMSDDTTTTDDDEEHEGRRGGDQHRRRRTEEERRQQKEEDDLFAQAWQAMSDEKAKGTWDVES